MSRVKKYRSKKHPVLEYIFNKYYDSNNPQKIIPFYLKDISEGYNDCNIPEPVSISNTILDLTRKDRGINSRVPESISELGYDLRKKTGEDSNGIKLAGEFVFVGIGKSIKSWLIWPDDIVSTIIDSSNIPELVLKLIRSDEGGLFSIIDYADVFSQILHSDKRKIYRIQNPMKWQPNEIDGFYISKNADEIILYPVEAKALTTGDEINLDQLQGGFRTVLDQISRLGLRFNVQQIAIKMIDNGIDVALFPINQEPITPEKYYRVKFSPSIDNWKK